MLSIPDRTFYLVDFDHGVQALAPSPYIASASETIPAGATMELFDVTSESGLVDSGGDARQGGESFYAWRGGQLPRSGYNMTNSPELGGPWTMEFLVKPNFGYTPAEMYVLYEGERLVGGSVNSAPYLYIGGTLAGDHKVYWEANPEYIHLVNMESTTELEEDQWYHIAMVLEDTDAADAFKLYIDGVCEDSSYFPDTWAPWFGVSGEFGLGSSLIASTRNYRGLMDAFAVQTIAVDPNDFILPISYCAQNDITGDCIVDIDDLSILSAQWLSCTMPGDPHCDYDRPEYMIPQGVAVVDGDLSEWDDVDWIALDEPYHQTADDISEAKFSVRWDSATNKIYAAVVVHDSIMTFTDEPGSWDASDRIEVYSQGDHAGGTGYGAGGSELFDIAQQYLVGSTSNKIDHWSVFANNDPNVGAGYAEFESAVVVDDINGIIYYELGVKQFDHYGGISGDDTVVSDLQAGDIVGFDIVADTRFSIQPWDFGALSENMDTGKYNNAAAFAAYTLEGAEECGDYGYKQADIKGPAGIQDCYVNLHDFAAMASEWMMTWD